MSTNRFSNLSIEVESLKSILSIDIVFGFGGKYEFEAIGFGEKIGLIEAPIPLLIDETCPEKKEKKL